MQRDPAPNDGPLPAVACAPDPLEAAIRQAPSAGVILAAGSGGLRAANAPARQLLAIRARQEPAGPIASPYHAELVRAARSAVASGRCAWFGIDGDVVEVHASEHGDAIVAWLDPSRRSLAARLRPNLEDALHCAGIGFWEYDLDNDHMLWDPQCFALFGRDPSSGPPGRNELLAHVHPEDRDRVDRTLRAAADPGGASGIVFRVVLPDGSIRHIDSRAEPVRRPGMRVRRLVGLVFDVTDSREAAAAQRRLNERLAALSEAAGVGLWSLDLQRGRGEWNAQMYRMFGHPPTEPPLSFAECMQRVDAADRDRLQNELLRVIERGGVLEREVHVRGSDGESRWIHVRGQRERATPGAPLVGMCLDVTATRAAMARSTQLAERLRMATDASGVGIWDLDVARGRSFWNERMYELYGVPAHQRPFDVDQWLDALHPDDRAHVALEWRRVLDGEPEVRFEFRLVRGDGSVRDVLTRARALPDGAGRVTRVLRTDQDVTELRAAERAARANAERLQLAKESAHLGLWTFEVESGRLEWDAQTYALFGADRNDPRPPFEIFHAGVHAEDRARIGAATLGAASGHGMLDARYRVVHRDGSIHHIATRADLSGTGPQRRLIGVSWEITDFVVAEAAQRARETAERANRAKSEFVARLSHALRTPLNAMLGSTQLLEKDRDEALSDGQRERVERIRNAGFQLLNLVNDVLDLARIEAGAVAVNVEVVELAPLVGAALEAAAAAAAAREIVLEGEIEPDAPRRVWADRSRLRQVLGNLIANAIKYNRHGGRVDVVARGAAPGMARIIVRDTGIGMTGAQVEALFTPFHRTGRLAGETEGSGLGLAVSAKLVEQMHGTMHVTSTVGVGSEFCVALREVPGGAGLAQASAAPEQTPAREDVQGSVLYVEDTPGSSLLVEQLLHSRPNVRLYKAPDGATGLVLAAACRPDLVLIDVRLPDMDGLEVLRRLRARPETARTACVAVFAHAPPDDVERARAGGFEHCWSRPFDAGRFLAGIDDLLGVRPGPDRT
jgi:PAS domain S-box-containing protein